MTNTYKYKDGTIYCSERREIGNKRDTYIIKQKYDANNYLIEEDSVNKKSKSKSVHKYQYMKVGTVVMSTEKSSELITADKWQYYDDLNHLPIPSSCLKSITPTKDQRVFSLPFERGMFVEYVSSNDFSYSPEKFDTTKTYAAFENYQHILSDVCGYDVEVNGNEMNVSVSGIKIATIKLMIDPKNGASMTIENK